MRVLQINTVYGTGSTGRIAKEIHDLCRREGIDCLCGHRGAPKGTAALADSVAIASWTDSRIHGVLARYTMFKGCFSYFRTKRFLKRIKAYQPDLIHLHNLHGSYVNIGLLLGYIKKHRIPAVMTLHDCWAFTGICSHFALSGCNQWQSGCGCCPQRGKYSSAPVDLSDRVWKLKKKWFTGVPNLTVVTPSGWLAGLVQQSFLKDYPVKVIYNGIDLDAFAPTASDFKEKYGLQNKKIVLAVAFGWGYGKGLDVVAALAQRLPADYRVVIVGTDAEAEKALPENVLAIRRTHDQRALAEIYTAADVLINPTREEVLGLVNLEALACGTPVVTFRAGGSPECIDATCGSVVEIDDVDAMEREVLRICAQRPYSREACRSRAAQFDKNERLQEYLQLYKELV